MIDIDKLKIGMKVWDIILSEPGEIIDIDSRQDYCITVKFPSNSKSSFYNKEGKVMKGGTLNRSLYFSKPLITAEENPVYSPTLIGTYVLCLSHNNLFTFKGDVIKEDPDKIYLNNRELCKDKVWVEIIKTDYTILAADSTETKFELFKE